MPLLQPFIPISRNLFNIVPILSNNHKRSYYKYKVEQTGNYTKTTTVISNDHHTYYQPTKIVDKIEEKSLEISKPSIMVEFALPILKLIFKEFQENEDFRKWVKTSIVDATTWIQKKIDSVKSIGIGAGSHKEFVLLPESTKDTDDAEDTDDIRIRKALELLLTGKINDYHIILGKEYKEDTKYTSDELDKAYKSRLMKWHPDHNKDQEELAHIVFLKIRDSYSRIKSN